MGSMDWLTTAVGILYFGAVECNPLFASMTQTNFSGFTAIKLSTTIFVGFLFYEAEKTCERVQDRSSKSFACVRYVLKGAYLASAIFLFIAVMNNILAMAKII